MAWIWVLRSNTVDTYSRLVNLCSASVFLQFIHSTYRDLDLWSRPKFKMKTFFSCLLHRWCYWIGVEQLMFLCLSSSNQMYIFSFCFLFLLKLQEIGLNARNINRIQLCVCVCTYLPRCELQLIILMHCNTKHIKSRVKDLGDRLQVWSILHFS